MPLVWLNLGLCWVEVPKWVGGPEVVEALAFFLLNFFINYFFTLRLESCKDLLAKAFKSTSWAFLLSNCNLAPRFYIF